MGTPHSVSVAGSKGLLDPHHDEFIKNKELSILENCPLTTDAAQTTSHVLYLPCPPENGVMTPLILVMTPFLKSHADSRLSCMIILTMPLARASRVSDQFQSESLGALELLQLPSVAISSPFLVWWVLP